MKNQDSLLFSTTSIPDLFFTEYLSMANGDYVKIKLLECPLIQSERYPYKKMKFEHTEERPCKDTGRREPSGETKSTDILILDL